MWSPDCISLRCVLDNSNWKHNLLCEDYHSPFFYLFTKNKFSTRNFFKAKHSLWSSRLSKIFYFFFIIYLLKMLSNFLLQLVCYQWSLNYYHSWHSFTCDGGKQASGSGRARRDAAARAMQGWHSQRLLGNGEVSDPIIKVRWILNFCIQISRDFINDHRFYFGLVIL